MSNLTAKQEAFCIAYIETGNASESYRRAYNAEKSSPGVVNNKASMLLARDDIRVRLSELRKPVIAAVQMTLASHLERLRELSLRAEEDGQFAAAVKAEELRGKASGLYTDKIDHTNSDGSLRPSVIRIVAEAMPPKQ